MEMFLQAAIGPVFLDNARKFNKPEWEPMGREILTLAVWKLLFFHIISHWRRLKNSFGLGGWWTGVLMQCGQYKRCHLVAPFATTVTSSAFNPGAVHSDHGTTWSDLDRLPWATPS